MGTAIGAETDQSKHNYSQKLLLPTQRALYGLEGQGWLIETEVRQSRIGGAGNGRFTAGAAKTGSTLLRKYMIDMSQVDALRTVPLDHIIRFSNVEDLEKFITLSAKEGGYSRNEILDLFANFVWSTDGELAYLCNSTWSMNHGDEILGGLNTVYVAHKHEGKDAMKWVASKDLAADEEIMNNYRDFKLPQFYLNFCQAQKIQDVRSMVMTAIGADREQVSKRSLSRMNYCVNLRLLGGLCVAFLCHPKTSLKQIV